MKKIINVIVNIAERHFFVIARLAKSAEAILFIVLVALSLSTSVFAEIPHYMQFQGKATDINDTPLNSPHDLTFRIYDAETAGNLIWNETHNHVQIENGIFSVILGGVNPLNVSFDKPYWISMEIGISGEMPRQTIASVGYAYRAGEADYAKVSETTKSQKLTISTIVNLDPSMTVSEIQVLIDAQPRYIPHGKALTFQFTDGTYVLSTGLAFDGFYGGGTVYIQGNPSERGLHTNQAVFLDFSGQDCHGINIFGCNMRYMGVRNLKIKVKTDFQYRQPVYVYTSFGARILYNYCLGTSTMKGYGIYFNQSIGYVGECYVENMRRGITAYNSRVSSYKNDDVGTMPLQALVAMVGSTIGKASSKQPSGSVQNEYVGAGAVIR